MSVINNEMSFTKYRLKLGPPAAAEKSGVGAAGEGGVESGAVRVGSRSAEASHHLHVRTLIRLRTNNSIVV